MQYVPAITYQTPEGDTAIRPAHEVPGALAWEPTPDNKGWNVYETYPDGSRDDVSNPT